jgi:1-acyl-sn-glycerol-3-phosphate acyltransferase
LWYLIFKAIALRALRLWFRPRVEGLEHLPDGGVLVVSNHLSFSDSLFLGAILPRKLTFLAKASYFDGPGVRGWLTARFMVALGQIPIDRAGGSVSDGALRAGADVLLRGGLLGMYPEGTRSPDGRLYRGRTGAARLALTTSVPVLPVALTGTDRAQPPGRVMLRTVPIRIVIGSPLTFSAAAGSHEDGRVLRQVTDEIMREIQRLSGQKYVDEYSTRHRTP